MIVSTSQAEVVYTCRQMFDLVADIDSYHYFLRHCTKSRIVEKESDHVVGELVFSLVGFSIDLISTNILHPHTEIIMKQKSGTLTNLSGTWLFQPLDSQRGTRVSLTMQFQVPVLLNIPGFKIILKGLTDEFVASFTNRAQSLYGQ